MKIKILILISLTILFTSCASMRKGSSSLSRKDIIHVDEPQKPKPIVEPKKEPVIEVKEEPAKIVEPQKEVQPAIVVREEQVVDIDINEPEYDFYVIVGSFQSVANAKNFQSQLIERGFIPNVLESEIGFYRVSIAAYNDEIAVRQRISQIRESYSEFHDVWLLKKKK